MEEGGSVATAGLCFVGTASEAMATSARREEFEAEARNGEQKQDPPPSIGDPHQFYFRIDGIRATADERRENTPCGGLFVAKDKEEVKLCGEFGKAESEDKTAKHRSKSKMKNPQIKSLEHVNNGNGTGERGFLKTAASLNVVDVLPMNAESERVVNRRKIGSKFSSQQEYRIKQDELNKTGGKPSAEVENKNEGVQRRHWQKGSRADDTLKVKEVDSKSEKVTEDEFLKVCNAVYSLNTCDEKGISEPIWNEKKETEANTVDEKCSIGENVDKNFEINGRRSHREKGSFGSEKSALMAENLIEDYHVRVIVEKGDTRNLGPRGGYNPKPFNYRNGGNMRSRVEFGQEGYANLRRFESGWSRKEGNRHSVWMKRGEFEYI